MIGAPRLEAVAEALEAARRAGVAPALSAQVLVSGEPVHASMHGTWTGDDPAAPARALRGDDLFDVASLTKVLATTTLAAQAVAEGALELEVPAARWLRGFKAAGKGGVTVRHLLAHRSGLPWWRPWHEQVAAHAGVEPRRAAMAAALFAEPLEAEPGTRAVYSDPGYMALGLLLEAALGQPLGALFEARVARPLGLHSTFFLDARQPAEALARSAGRAFLPTRRDPVRGLRQGTVDDDNAWALGGAAGHAGLFSTAAEVAKLGQAWLDALAGKAGPIPPAVALEFTRRDSGAPGERPLGWDVPSAAGSTLGARLGRGPRGAIGHLGFTGCSLWLDLDASLVAVLLSNHVHPDGNDGERINGARRAFHDAVAGALGLG